MEQLNKQQDSMNMNHTLKLKEIDQLHDTVSQFSKSTIETKKICATLVVAVATIILKVTDNHLDPSLYVTTLSVVFIFWLIDSNFYYYQRKVRIRLDAIVKELQPDRIIVGFGMPISNQPKLIFSSLFNHSQIFYLVIGLGIGLMCFLDLTGVF